jgi:hypothetical protein
MKPENTIIGAWEQKDNISGTFERSVKGLTTGRKINGAGELGDAGNNMLQFSVIWGCELNN